MPDGANNQQYIAPDEMLIRAGRRSRALLRRIIGYAQRPEMRDQRKALEQAKIIYLNNGFVKVDALKWVLKKLKKKKRYAARNMHPGELRNRARTELEQLNAMTAHDIVELAEQIDCFEESSEQVKFYQKPKFDSQGKIKGYRTIHDFGLIDRAKQLIVAKVLRATTESHPDQYLLRGGRNAAISPALPAMRDGHTYVGKLDITKCYDSFNPETIGDYLPLHSKIVQNVVLCPSQDRMVDTSIHSSEEPSLQELSAMCEPDQPDSSGSTSIHSRLSRRLGQRAPARPAHSAITDQPREERRDDKGLYGNDNHAHRECQIDHNSNTLGSLWNSKSTCTKATDKKCLPQGSALSPIVAEILIKKVLDSIPAHLMPDDVRIFIYADDILILGKHKNSVGWMIELFEHYAASHSVGPLWFGTRQTPRLEEGVTFLGYALQRYEDGQIIARPPNWLMLRFVDYVDRLAGRVTVPSNIKIHNLSNGVTSARPLPPPHILTLPFLRNVIRTFTNSYPACEPLQAYRDRALTLILALQDGDKKKEHYEHGDSFAIWHELMLPHVLNLVTLYHDPPTELPRLVA